MTISVGSYVALCAVIIFAAAVQSSTGFGFSIVAVPLLAVIVHVREAVVLNLVLAMVSNAAVTIRVRQQRSVRVVGPMIVGGLVGLLPGLMLFYSADVAILRAGIGVLVVGVAVFLLMGKSFQFHVNRAVTFFVGATSGFLGGGMGLAGPPLTVFFSGLGMSKERYRATMSVYFTMLNLVLVPVHIVLSGSTRLLVASLLLLPAVVVGQTLGEVAFTRISERRFLQVASLIVLAAGLGGVAAGVL